MPAGITKGRKFRTTWISYEALTGLHDYLQLTAPPRPTDRAGGHGDDGVNR